MICRARLNLIVGRQGAPSATESGSKVKGADTSVGGVAVWAGGGQDERGIRKEDCHKCSTEPVAEGGLGPELRGIRVGIGVGLEFLTSRRCRPRTSMHHVRPAAGTT